MRGGGDGLVEGLRRTRPGSGPIIQIALELLLDYNLRELSGIGRRDGGRGGGGRLVQ